MYKITYLILIFTSLPLYFVNAKPVAPQKTFNAASIYLTKLCENDKQNHKKHINQIDNAIVGLSKGQNLSDCFQKSQFFKSNEKNQISYISKDLLKLSGSASLVNLHNDQTVLRLTTSQPWQTGYAFIKSPKTIQSFSTFFSFKISEPYYSGADGFVFVIKSEIENLGGYASGLGYSGIKNCIGIEFDSYLNYEYNDPNDHHVGIVLNGDSLHPLDYSYISPDFKNGNTWYVWIDYNGKNLEVRVNHCLARPEKSHLSKQIDIFNILGNDVGFFGFTGATGGYWENHDILEWELKEKFEPIIKNVNVVRYYVDKSIEISGNGLSWETAFKTIHEAVNQAGCLVDIFIKQGNYLINEPIIIQAMQTNIYGGFEGDENDINDRSSNIITTINGQNFVQCFVVENEKKMLLDRLTIINGKSDNGGAIFINNAEVFIKNVIFKHNNALYNGGAIWNFSESILELVNCLFINNQSESNTGGAIYGDYHSNTAIYNCTFFGNSAKTNGGALFLHKSNADIVNSIFWNNKATQESEISIDELSKIDVSFSTIKGYFFGHGNIDDDPNFIDPDADNYHLRVNSPCINVGSEKIERIDFSDLSSNLRQKGRIDMGAYEFQNTFEIIKPNIINIHDNKIEAQGSISISNQAAHDLIVSLKSETINLPLSLTLPSGITNVSFNLTIPETLINEESTCYTMIACIENYVTSTYVLQIDENKTITFTSHNPDWPGYPLLEITDNNNSTENMEIYNLDNSLNDTNSHTHK
ncbi:MAG: hypothetical protein OMM_03191 [Candidatus Magnetoglobus multicellularis str. Araruama]|uniref:Legume lectin domain-containing protein n=1 Tax=Candidatus Magnetoglobus multicellularis str. Araruama TaxID=890399 RepID=A0A1V1P6K4_9BACT|nr:MAG: hypothetical protein OMM_03191 [Candidatus Magnetoglobus multicellularis str. Araruama]